MIALSVHRTGKRWKGNVRKGRVDRVFLVLGKVFQVLRAGRKDELRRLLCILLV